MADQKKINDLSKTEKEAIILQALQKEGYSDSQVSQLLELSRSRMCQVNKKIKNGQISPLVNKAMINKVKKSLKLLIEGKPVGEMKDVRGTDVLGALKLAAERIDPVTVKTENTNISMQLEITQADRERYQNLLGAIEAEYEVVEPKLIENKKEEE